MCHPAVLTSQRSPEESRIRIASRSFSIASAKREALYNPAPKKLSDCPCPQTSPRDLRISSDLSPYFNPRRKYGTIVITGECSEYACASSGEGGYRSARFISRRWAQPQGTRP